MLRAIRALSLIAGLVALGDAFADTSAPVTSPSAADATVSSTAPCTRPTRERPHRRRTRVPRRERVRVVYPPSHAPAEASAPSTSSGPSTARRSLVTRTVMPWDIRVHDGDTFYVGLDTIRLRGIDTPELGEPRAVAARDRLVRLLSAGPVTIVERAQDVYGRTVADVYVAGVDVARTLRAEGFDKPRRPPRH